MDVALLRSFVSVADTGSFSGAAERLHLTQSTISHQIARLEASIGRRLFERTTRSCSLTSAGHQLLRKAREIVLAVDDLTAQYKPNSIRGDLRLGVPDDDHLFGPIMNAIVRFSREQPGINISVTAGLSATLAHRTGIGELDLAILREIIPLEPARPSLADLVWIAGPGWPTAGYDILPLALVNEPCVYRQAALAALNSAECPHRVVISCTSLTGVLAAVEASFAVSVVTRQHIPASARILDASHGLPDLPSTTLALRFHGERRTVVGHALANRLEQELSSSQLVRQFS